MKPIQQIALGLLVAVALLVTLQWWVSQASAAPVPVAPVPAPGSVDLPKDPGPEGRLILKELRGQAAAFELTADLGDLPDGCEPVLEIRPGGGLRVAVAVPLSTAPGALRWPRVGILLPRVRLAELSPAERASLLAIWSRLTRSTLAAESIHLHGCQARPGEIDLLLRWVR